MNYSELIGTCKTIGLPPRIEGIGDEPLDPISDGAVMIMHKPCGKLPRGVKIDQHNSFPKGLPPAFRLSDEHLKD